MSEQRSEDRGVWIPCSTRMPPAGLDVFAFYRNSLGKGRTARAEYAPPRAIPADQWLWDDDFDDFDDDEQGNEWVPTGWWERALTPEASYPITETITHWMLIPEPPHE